MMKTLTTVLFIRRTVLLTSLALIPGLPVLFTHAAAMPPGSGIPEIMTVAQPPGEPQAVTAAGTPAQTAWVQEIKNSLAMYKTNYPASNFAPYVTKLDLVRDAVSTGNRRAVKTEMGAFFKMLAKRDHGISGVAADELTNFAQMVTPMEEYGIAVPRSGPAQYGSEVPGSGSSQ